MLAAACHVEEQYCSLLRQPQGLPGAVTLVDEDWAPPVLSSTSGALLFPSSILPQTSIFS